MRKNFFPALPEALFLRFGVLRYALADYAIASLRNENLAILRNLLIKEQTK
jgi:hypothetical protein